MSGRTLRVLAVARTEEVRDRVAEALAGWPGAKLEARLGELKALAASLPRPEAADILVLDLDAEDEADLAAFDGLRRAAPTGGGTAIVATASGLSPAAMRRLLRAGADDVIPQPIVPAELAEALRAVEAKGRQERAGATGGGQAGRVVTFTRASGGVGATTLAVNTAMTLVQPARKGSLFGGRPAPAPSACLIDLDLQFGAAGLQLDLPPCAGMVDLVQDPGRLDGEMLRGLMVEHASGLKVLTAPKAPIPLEAMRPELAAEILRLARAEFEVVVVDLPQALTRWTETVMGASSDILLVTQLHVPALRQLRRLLDVLHEEGLYALPYRVVLNRHAGRSFWGQGVGYGQAERALGRKIDFVVGNDYRGVVDSLNQGRPLLHLDRRSRIVRDVRAMLDVMLRPAQPAPTA
jgi:pilus assembly protein CpaE